MKVLDTIREFFAPSEDDTYESDSVRETRGGESRFDRPRKENPAADRDSVRDSGRDSVRDSHTRISPDRDISTTRIDRIDRTSDIEPVIPQQRERGKVVNIQTTAQLQVVLVKPEVFTDAKQIADHLIAKKTVVLNLETASAENKRRIIDFLVGVAYANGGSLKPVANLTYIITPYNVGFIGEDLVSELETNGVIM